MKSEDYCSYELSKKLFDAGFDWPCDCFYYKESSEDDEIRFCRDGREDYNHDDWNVHHFSAPTLSLVQKWLREVHEIYIVISPYVASGGIRYIRQIWHHLDRTDISECRQIGFKTYELALSDALTKALELI